MNLNCSSKENDWLLIQSDPTFMSGIRKIQKYRFCFGSACFFTTHMHGTWTHSFGSPKRIHVDAENLQRNFDFHILEYKKQNLRFTEIL